MNCPICQTAMVKNITHGVEVDVCREHGIWLEKGELPKIIARVRSIYSDGMAHQKQENREKGRLEGIFFGWLSFFLPK